MTRTRAAGGGAGRVSANGRTRSLREIMDALRDIAASEEPAVVLSSLARTSTPSFSDACTVELSEGTEALFRVCFPIPGEAKLPADAGPGQAAAGPPPVGVRSVITTLEVGSSHGYPSFAGIVSHFWAERDPTEDDAIIARLLVDRALAIVRNERLAQAAASADSRAAKLAIDLITTRIVGEATGMLMAKHQVTRARAASLLRHASQERQRRLPEIAAGVVRTGEIESLLPRDAGSPSRSVDLHIVASADHPPGKTRLHRSRNRDPAHLR
jgi:ANTAR domain